jgi:predicted RNA-binding protein with PUA-like domain
LPDTSAILEHLQQQQQAIAAMQQMAMQQATQPAPTGKEFDPEAEAAKTQLDIQKIQAQQAAKMEADLVKMRERSRLLQENDAAKSMVSLSEESLRRNIFDSEKDKSGNKQQ